MANEYIKVKAIEQMYLSAMCLILLGNEKSKFPIEQSLEITEIMEISSNEFSSIVKFFQKKWAAYYKKN